MAAKVRPTAKPLPFSVCANSGFAVLSRLKRMLERRAWKSVIFEQELISL